MVVGTTCSKYYSRLSTEITNLCDNSSSNYIELSCKPVRLNEQQEKGNLKQNVKYDYLEQNFLSNSNHCLPCVDLDQSRT